MAQHLADPGGQADHEAVDAEMGRDYRLQASDDLVNWEDVLEFNNTQETTLFLDGEAMFFPLRFYRVVLP